MNANMNNVARTVSHQQQGVVLAQQLQEAKIIQQNTEKASTVRKAADNEAKSMGINDEGHNSQASYNQSKKKKSQEPEEVPEKHESVIRESYLGIHIDIER